ncbi:phage late control D family protein [Paenibacillus naphthalenovorans]|uniref:phage late control D family protein n=1 Tax=Paenibacillus naphthalenovorans TaxID=162209 RepID=UPI000884F2D7|nr:hypothetical protein [Paenibacillus naphthalenovorans]SDI49016.1 Phage protein D [Paenibacillus naphthalenovorans]
MSMDAPRAIVEVEGATVRWDDLIDMRLENTLYFAADSFEIQLNNENMLSDWLRKEQEVRIYLGFVNDPGRWSKQELQHVFTGKIDGVKPSFAAEKTVQIIGRDYSARYLDTDSSIAFANQSSDEIAILLANKYGLTPVVTPGVATLDKEMFSDKKEWDILQMLADREGFICYVDKDKQLYFGPRQDETDEAVVHKFSRKRGYENCTLEFDDSAVGVVNTVTVRHWHKKRLIEASAKDDFLIQQMGQVKERIVYESKATTPELAQTLAQKRLKEWSRQVITGRAWGPLVPELIAERKVATEGCGRFDGDYYIDRVTHSISKMGATSEVDITNVRPETAQQYRQDLYDYQGAKL